MNADTTSTSREPVPDNVVALGDQIIKDVEQTKAATELERRRSITVRALEIAGKQLEADAQRFLESAVVGEVPPKRRIELMEQAKCLYVASAWLSALTSPPTQTEQETK